jgi:hypothetical protein
MDTQQIYNIRVKGHLDNDWSNWFEGLAITLEADGTTLLSGPFIDQCALYGLLKRIHDLNLPLISVNLISSNVPDYPASERA